MVLVEQAHEYVIPPVQQGRGGKRGSARSSATKHLDEAPLFGKQPAQDIERLELLPHLKRLMALQACT